MVYVPVGIDSGGYLPPEAKVYPVFTPEQYGADPTGASDSTVAVRAAFNAANAAMRVGLGGNIFKPGATVVMNGIYAIATIATPIDVSCNVQAEGATLIAPVGYSGTVLRVGHTTSGYTLHNAKITLPDVLKFAAPTLVAGSIGVQIQNLDHSTLTLGRIAYFETGSLFTAFGAGTGYNTIHLGWTDLCKVSIKLAPDATGFPAGGGWVNQNTFIAGGVTQSPNAFGGAAIRRSGWRHLVLDGGAGNTVHGNTFVGCSFEGDYSEFAIEFHNAAENIFHGSTRFEQGTAGVVCVVNNTFNSFTMTGNPLGVSTTAFETGLVFIGDALPTGLVAGRVYLGKATGADIILQYPLGTNIDITTDGTNVKAFRPPTLKFDNTDGKCRDNIIRDYNSYPGPLDPVRAGAAAPAAKTPVVG